MDIPVLDAAAVDPQQPWASFCIATYRRPDRLAATLRALLAQTMSDFEVIVSDNDSDGSAGPVVTALGDPRFRYSCNGENLGMVKNFNAALARARGRFVTLMADDDPPYPPMLATLRGLSEQHPGYGVYHGGFDIVFESENLAAAYGVPLGTREQLADRPRGATRAVSAAEFPLAFMTGRLFPMVLWSVGVVRRDVALAIGGVPDYGLPVALDMVYLALAGAHDGCAIVNLPLGRYTCQAGGAAERIFSQPWATTRPDGESWRELRRWLDGFHGCLTAAWSGRPDWHLIRPTMERWLVELLAVYLATGYRLRHGGAAPMTLEALRDSMTALRFILALPYLRGARSLAVVLNRWWGGPW